MKISTPQIDYSFLFNCQEEYFTCSETTDNIGLIENKIVYEEPSAAAATSSPIGGSSGTPMGGELCSRYV